MAALSAMVSLEIPQVNIMTKMDLLSPKAKKEIEKYVLKAICCVHLMKLLCAASDTHLWKACRHSHSLTLLFRHVFVCFGEQVPGPRHVLYDGRQLGHHQERKVQEADSSHLWSGE